MLLCRGNHKLTLNHKRTVRPEAFHNNLQNFELKSKMKIEKISSLLHSMRRIAMENPHSLNVCRGSCVGISRRRYVGRQDRSLKYYCINIIHVVFWFDYLNICWTEEGTELNVVPRTRNRTGSKGNERKLIKNYKRIMLFRPAGFLLLVLVGLRNGIYV